MPVRFLSTLLLIPLAPAACAQQPVQAAPPEALLACIRPQVHANRAWNAFFPPHSAEIGPRSLLVLDEQVAAKRRGDELFISLRAYTDTSETEPTAASECGARKRWHAILRNAASTAPRSG